MTLQRGSLGPALTTNTGIMGAGLPQLRVLTAPDSLLGLIQTLSTFPQSLLLFSSFLCSESHYCTRIHQALGGFFPPLVSASCAKFGFSSTRRMTRDELSQVPAIRSCESPISRSCWSPNITHSRKPVRGMSEQQALPTGTQRSLLTCSQETCNTETI